MVDADFTIRPVVAKDNAWVRRVMDEHWGGDNVRVHGMTYTPSALPGFVAEHGTERVGLLSFALKEGDSCEIVTLNSFRAGIGVGSALVSAVTDKATRSSCGRLWLVTTNDNLTALRFYQRRGFRLVALRPRAVWASRQIKPSIPVLGNFDIPIDDEIELERALRPSHAEEDLENVVSTLLVEMESAALRRWGQGDPDGFLEISTPDVVYFDPFVARRIDGLAALRDYYNGLRGSVHFDRFELLNPRVTRHADSAILTFNYSSTCDCRVPATHSRWNCTEVFALTEGAWRIVQTHWSRTCPTTEAT